LFPGAAEKIRTARLITAVVGGEREGGSLSRKVKLPQNPEVRNPRKRAQRDGKRKGRKKHEREDCDRDKASKRESNVPRGGIQRRRGLGKESGAKPQEPRVFVGGRAERAGIQGSYGKRE